MSRGAFSAVRELVWSSIGVGSTSLGRSDGRRAGFDSRPEHTYPFPRKVPAVLPLEMTKHAIDRALDMAIEGEEIREAFIHPERIYWLPRHEAWTYQRGRIALGVREEGKTHLVLTILWATDEAWVEDAVKAPLMEGRELRGVAKSLAQEEGVR